MQEEESRSAWVGRGGEGGRAALHTHTSQLCCLHVGRAHYTLHKVHQDDKMRANGK